MSGDTSGAFPGNRAGKAPGLESTQGDDAAAGAGAVPTEDLVERAFAILAAEKERWQATRSANPPPRSSS
jgi:hypothetical protein